MIRKAERKDLPIIAELACRLWTDNTAQEMQEEMAGIMERPDAAFFLAYDEENAVGFAQCQLRHDYVEGTDSSPVGYLEGIYVADGYRKQGIAKELLAACENWAKIKGCVDEHSEGDCYTRDCVLKQGIACCGACEQFPCDTIMTKPHTTVLDKDWLRWKKESVINR